MSVPGLAVWMLKAGIASTISKLVAAIADRSGRRRTGVRIRAQMPLSVAFHRIFLINGTRPFSTRSPSQARSAGKTVSEPATATATTMIVPVANDVNVDAPPRYIPAIATITVRPETSTARPEVAAAASSDASGLRPDARSSRSRRR